MNWYIDVLKKYAQFDGRARRMEYWMFVLFNTLVGIALIAFGAAITAFVSRGNSTLFSLMLFAPFYIYVFATLIPGLAVSIRRLHDTGKSGWWFLLSFVPGVGG